MPNEPSEDFLKYSVPPKPPGGPQHGDERRTVEVYTKGKRIYGHVFTHAMSIDVVEAYSAVNEEWRTVKYFPETAQRYYTWWDRFKARFRPNKLPRAIARNNPPGGKV